MRIDERIGLNVLEKQISESLRDCDIWADLRIPESDYRVLTNKIKSTLSSNSIRAFIRIMELYPLCCVTQMVFYMVYEYGDEFWGPWANELGIAMETNQSSSIGRVVNRIFTTWGFSYDDDGYAYITPLTCQAGVPNKCLAELFDAVDGEGQHSLDPFSLVNDLLGWKSYQIHKPVYRYICTYRNKAASLLADINDIIHSSSGALIADSYDERLIACYDYWRIEQNENKWKRKKAQQDYPLPSLAFADDGRGICLRLPSIVSKNEYASNIKWTIVAEPSGTIEQIHCKYRLDADKLFTDETLIAVEPAASYRISLYDDISGNKALKEQTIPGTGNEDFVLFDGRGKRVVDGFLPLGQGFVVLNRNVAMAEFSFMNRLELDMPKRARSYRAWYFALENEKAQITIHTATGRKVFAARSPNDARLVNASFLFDEEPINGALSMYTDFPMLFIDKPGNDIDDFSVTIRHRQSGYKKAESAEAIVSSEGILELSSLVADITKPYGIYDIRIYERGSFAKSFAFAYVPSIPFNTDCLDPWPSKYSNIGKTGFDFKCPDGVRIEISGDARLTTRVINGETWSSITVDTPATNVSGTLTCMCGDRIEVMPWSKRVRYFEWKLWNETEPDVTPCFETQIIEDAKLELSKYWLSIWMRADKTMGMSVLKLTNKSGVVLQQTDVKPSANGRWTIPLAMFETTLDNNKLPADISLSIIESGNERTIVLAHLTEAILLPALKYQCNESTKGRPVLMWRAERAVPTSSVMIKGITEPNFEMITSFEKTKTTTDQLQYGLILRETLPAGLFKLEPFIEDDFFLEDIGYKPPVLQGRNIISVNLSDLNNIVYTLNGILKHLLALSSRSGPPARLIDFYTRNKDKVTVDVTEETCKLLVCLMCNFANEDDEIARLTIDLVNDLNYDLITDEHRALFTKWILGYSLSVEQLKLCFTKLKLHLAASDKCITLERTEIRRVGEISSELEILWMLRLGIRQGLQQKLISIVGIDALKNMISFKPGKECSNPLWYDCLERTINGVCSCTKAAATKGICGRSDDFKSMFDWGERYSLPTLDLSRRPENDEYFCGQTYVDLLISWYFYNTRKGINPGEIPDRIQSLYPHMDALKRILLSVGGNVTEDYFKKMSGRDMGVKQGFFPPFYYTAIAAMSAALFARSKITEAQYEPAQRFLNAMTELFPEMVRRDLLLCELLIFFNGGI